MSFVNNISLKCPFSNKKLLLKKDGLYDDNNLLKYPKTKGAYRVAKNEGYVGNFGFQWNKFVKTQIDREVSSSQQSTERLLATTGWDKENLENKTILEVGCGAGRFTKVVMEHTKAELHSVDYSNAVEACYQNNKQFEHRLFIYQASIYEMPFENNTFDKVFCFGVLQHTPNIEKSLECLIEKANIGGEIIVDFYPINGWYTKIHAKYLLRPFTKKMKHEVLLNIIENNIDWMINITSFFNRIGIGKYINRFIPICDIKNTFPENLTEEQIREWAILDTFDMFSPQFDSPQKIKTVDEIFKKNNVKVTYSGFIEYGQGGKVAVVKGMKQK